MTLDRFTDLKLLDVSYCITVTLLVSFDLPEGKLFFCVLVAS